MRLRLISREGGFTRRNAGGNGFTLIELLVVVAIISLLVSILLPSLSCAKDLAKAVICSSNLHTLGLALNLFADDHDEQFPPRSTPYRYPDWGRFGSAYNWAHWMSSAWRNGYMGTYWPIYLGYVWKQGYFDPSDSGAQIISCPLNASYNHETMTAPEGTGGKSYCSYWYAPGKHDYRDAQWGDDGDYHTRRGVDNGALVWDAQCQWHDGGGMNVLRADGAARGFKYIPPNAYRLWGAYSEMDYDTPHLVNYFAANW